MHRKSATVWTIAFVCLVMVQAVAVLCWGRAKENYFIDELFSKGYAQDFALQREEFKYISGIGDCPWYRWDDASVLKRHLTTEPEETFLRQPPGEALKLLVSGRNYYGLLGLAESLAGSGDVSMKPGLALNLVLYVLLQAVFIRLLRRLNVRPPICLAAAAVFGFSGLMIGLAVFIRFYLLTNLFILCAYSLHLTVWQTKKRAVFLAAELASFALMVLSIRNSELALAVAGGLGVSFTAALLIRRRFADAAFYAGPVVGGGLFYLSRHTSYLRLIVKPAAFLEEASTKGGVARNVLDTTLPKVARYYSHYVWNTVARRLFGSEVLCILIFAALAALVIFWAVRGRRARPGERFGFVMVLAGTAAVYAVFLALSRQTSLDYASRYISFGLVPFVIVLAYGADRALGLLAQRRPKEARGFAAALAALAAASCIAGSACGNIAYLYRGDGEAIERFTALQASDVVATGDDFFALYECAAYIGSDARLFVAVSGLPWTETALPDDFVLWTGSEDDRSDTLEVLRQRGYVLEPVGKTHRSDIYRCVRAKTE